MPAGIQPLQIRRQPPAQRRVSLLRVRPSRGESLRVEDVKNPVGINAGRGGVRWGFSDGSNCRAQACGQQGPPQAAAQASQAEDGLKVQAEDRRAASEVYPSRADTQSRNELHRITAQLVKKYDHFAIEDMSIQELTMERSGHSGKSGSGCLNKGGNQPVDSGANVGRIRADPDIQGGRCRYVCGARRSLLHLGDVQ